MRSGYSAAALRNWQPRKPSSRVASPSTAMTARTTSRGGLPSRARPTASRPVRVQALTAELSGTPAWRTLPSWAVVATQDNSIPAQAQEFMAERAGSHVARVEASHAVSISQPDAVADLIIEAAKTTC
nr:alpha/beta hydrolase [Streptomyces sp. NRRL S-646]